MPHRKVTPGILAAELGLAGLHTLTTLWYRLPAIAAGYASAGRLQPEYGKMMGEKAAAWLDGMWDAQVETVRIAGEAATGRLTFADMAAAPSRIAAAGLRPAFRRVKANSRRLRRRSHS
jgi:hypothetical protein